MWAYLIGGVIGAAVGFVTGYLFCLGGFLNGMAKGQR